MDVQAKADPDQWKKKYFDALRSLEQEERGFRSLEAVLRRIVNRLCFASLGQAPALDAELRRLTDSMRRKAGEVELEQLFVPLSDAIGALDDRKPADKPASTPAPAAVAPPAAAREEPPALAGNATTIIATSAGVAASTAAAGTVRSPLDLESTAGTGTVPLVSATVTPLTPRPADAPHPDGPLACDERVRLLLSRILTELRRDARLAARVATLDAQLASALRESQLPVLLSAIADLTIERVSSIEQEKADVEKLLAQISARLDDMNAYMAGEDQDRKLSLENTQDLNNRLAAEMTELGVSVESTVDLVQLKMHVRSRLDSIGAHLQEFRSREDDRVRNQWDRSEKMRQRLERLEQESREMQARLRDEQRLSMVDALTQIPNRLAYDQRMDEEFARWHRFGQPLCLAAWDIDHFKRINDAYGHRAGDKVLRIVAAALTERLRETDFLARYGGEEFVMILPGTDMDGALRVADQMRAAVETLGFHFRGNPVSVSVSCGVSAFATGDTADEVFERADKALYRAKQGGRNRCERG